MIKSTTGFTVDGQSVNFPRGLISSEDEWDVNDDPDLDPGDVFLLHRHSSCPHHHHLMTGNDNLTLPISSLFVDRCSLLDTVPSAPLPPILSLHVCPQCPRS